MCSGLQAEILHCYSNHLHEVLLCSDLVKAYQHCVTTAHKVNPWATGLWGCGSGGQALPLLTLSAIFVCYARHSNLKISAFNTVRDSWALDSLSHLLVQIPYLVVSTSALGNLG